MENSVSRQRLALKWQKNEKKAEKTRIFDYNRLKNNGNFMQWLSSISFAHQKSHVILSLGSDLWFR